MNFQLSFKPLGACAILIEWPSAIKEVINHDIIAFDKKLSQYERKVDTVVAYNSLLVRFREPVLHFTQTVQELRELYSIKEPVQHLPSLLWKVPVCYDLSFGLDLEEIATRKKRSIEEIISLHAAPDYLVYFIGFLPGFLYLGGLNKELHIPRRSNPRLRVSRGSVAIGGAQTGVYPQDSAGGWNLIGKTPIDFFIPSNEQPCFAKPGDRIRFLPISKATYNRLAREVARRPYIPKSCPI